MSTVMTRAEVAAHCGVSTRTVYRWESRGLRRSARSRPRLALYTRAAVAAYLQRGRR